MQRYIQQYMRLYVQRYMTSTVIALLDAACADEAKPPDNLPILADALQDAGYDGSLLAELRRPDAPEWFRGRWLRRAVEGSLSPDTLREAYNGLVLIGSGIKDEYATNDPEERKYNPQYAFGVPFLDLMEMLDKYLKTATRHVFGFTSYSDGLDCDAMWKHYATLTGLPATPKDDFDETYPASPFRRTY